jgi:integrase
MKQRADNRGLRKLCEHKRIDWTKEHCKHSWYFNFKWKEKHYRLSLDKYLGKHVESKSEAADEAAKIRIAIKEGKFGQVAQSSTLTLRQLADAYEERYVKIKHADTADEYRYSLNSICTTVLPRATGGSAPLGEWLTESVITDTVLRLHEVRMKKGKFAANRSVRQLRALFSWGIKKGYVTRTPFKLNDENTIPADELPTEEPRSRRLESDEEPKLLAVCNPQLQSCVIAALETGMRKGEILSLQWKQVEGMTIKDQVVTWAPRSELFLPFAKTKTKKDRRIPISTRLKGILEMRRCDPKGDPHPLKAYVFGTEIGTKVDGFTRAWNAAVLRAHGHTPTYTAAKATNKKNKRDKRGSKNLSPESRAALKTINLHFHDLRREAGSRWMDGGVNLATVQRWLGHSNISQTSTYLAGTVSSEHDAMMQYENRLQQIATNAEKRNIQTPQSDVTGDEMLRKNAEQRGPTIM